MSHYNTISADITSQQWERVRILLKEREGICRVDKVIDTGRFPSQGHVNDFRLLLKAFDVLIESVSALQYPFTLTEYFSNIRTSHHAEMVECSALNAALQKTRAAFVDACNTMIHTSTKWIWTMRKLKAEEYEVSFNNIWMNINEAPAMTQPQYATGFT